MQDIYTDYLITQNGKASSTGLSSMLDNIISHDQITRFLNKKTYDSKDLWEYVKKHAFKKCSCDSGVLIFDDTISKKPHSKENDMISWHYDHAEGRCLKGINILTSFYNGAKIQLPIGYELIKKDEEYVDAKTGKKKRRAKISKNEHFRNHLKKCTKKDINFEYVLADSWYSSKENMQYISSLKKKFVLGVKSNRLFKMYDENSKKCTGDYSQLSNYDLKANRSYLIKLKGCKEPLNLLKKVFKNGDGSVGTLYIVSNDLELNSAALYAIYQKRWIIEDFHKEIKNHASLSKSPTKTVKTQSNHIYMSFVSYCKLEILQNKSCYKNQYQIKNLLLIKSNQAAMCLLKKLQNEIKSTA